MVGGLVQRALGKFGLRLVHVPRHPGGARSAHMGDYLVGLPDRLACDVVIDVGVAGGTPWLYDRFPKAKLLLVEPVNTVATLPQLLAGRDYSMFECAAGEQPGEVTINFNPARPGLSSIRQRSALTETGDSLQQKTVPVRTLDDIVAEAGCTDKAIGIEVDTEGFELEVMKGAAATLRHCNFVICEASIEKRFENSYDFSQLVAFLDSHGFYVSRVLNFRVDQSGFMRMADLLFEPRQR